MATILAFLVGNWHALLSILAIFLSGGVAIAHLFNANKVEAALQNLADVIGKVNSDSSSTAVSKTDSTNKTQ